MNRITLLSVLTVLLSALPKSAAAQCGSTPATGAVTWTTNWCDEFNGTANSAINPTKWTYDTGGGGGGNNRLETSFAPTTKPSPARPSPPNPPIPPPHPP